MTRRRFSDRTIRRRSLAPLLVALAFLPSGCGGVDPGGSGAAPKVDPPPAPRPPAALAEAEGRLDLVAPPGHAEEGSARSSADWVSDFETRTGCDVRIRAAPTSDDVVAWLASGRYDGAAVPSDAMLRVIASGDVAPLNPRLVRGYDDIAEGLRSLPFNVVGGRVYGVPSGRSATVLVWRRDRIPGAVSRSDAVFDPAQLVPYRGNVTSVDGPLAIADAAVWLAANRPELRITNPYELTDGQFQAAIQQLELQRPFIAAYWSNAEQAEGAFLEQDAVIGLAPQGVALALETARPDLTLQSTLPREGTTGVAVNWVVASSARHPGCMYRWLGHVLSPSVQAAISEHTGQAPANLRACEFTSDEEHCERVHADDEAYWSEVALRTTPVRDCGDERGRRCKSYEDWVAGWAEVGDSPSG